MERWRGAFSTHVNHFGLPYYDLFKCEIALFLQVQKYPSCEIHKSMNPLSKNISPRILPENSANKNGMILIKYKMLRLSGIILTF